MAKRLKLHEVSLEDDIKFRGPISFQGFQVLGWLCIVMTAAQALLALARSLDPMTKEMTENIFPIIQTVASFSLPFLLIANYSRILSNAEGYKKQLIRTGGTAAAITIGSYFFYNRYIAGNVRIFMDEPGQAETFLNDTIQSTAVNGFIAFNIFIDLFLCTLFLFFLTYHFKRPIGRGWVVGFRLLAILPVAYEFACIVLKTLCKNGNITLPLNLS